jgi:hypothetical protein
LKAARDKRGNAAISGGLDFGVPWGRKREVASALG